MDSNGPLDEKNLRYQDNEKNTTNTNNTDLTAISFINNQTDSQPDIAKHDKEIKLWCRALRITPDYFFKMSDEELKLRITNLKGRLRLKVAKNLIAYQKQNLEAFQNVSGLDMNLNDTFSEKNNGRFINLLDKNINIFEEQQPQQLRGAQRVRAGANIFDLLCQAAEDVEEMYVGDEFNNSNAQTQTTNTNNNNTCNTNNDNTQKNNNINNGTNQSFPSCDEEVDEIFNTNFKPNDYKPKKKEYLDNTDEEILNDDGLDYFPQLCRAAFQNPRNVNHDFRHTAGSFTPPQGESYRNMSNFESRSCNPNVNQPPGMNSTRVIYSPQPCPQPCSKCPPPPCPKCPPPCPKCPVPINKCPPPCPPPPCPPPPCPPPPCPPPCPPQCPPPPCPPPPCPPPPCPPPPCPLPMCPKCPPPPCPPPPCPKCPPPPTCPKCPMPCPRPCPPRCPPPCPPRCPPPQPCPAKVYPKPVNCNQPCPPPQCPPKCPKPCPDSSPCSMRGQNSSFGRNGGGVNDYGEAYSGRNNNNSGGGGGGFASSPCGASNQQDYPTDSRMSSNRGNSSRGGGGCCGGNSGGCRR